MVERDIQNPGSYDILIIPKEGQKAWSSEPYVRRQWFAHPSFLKLKNESKAYDLLILYALDCSSDRDVVER